MWLWNQIREEPVSFQGVLQAALAVIAGFGMIPDLTQERMGMVLALSAAILAFVTRRAVTPMVNPRTDDGRRLVANDPAPPARNPLPAR